MNHSKNLKEMETVPCHPKLPVMSSVEIAEYIPQLPQWDLVKQEGIRQLERTYEFDDFKQALAFTQRVGELAEAEDHHPTLLTAWGRVTVTWWTTAIGGLHLNDFIMAARTDEVYERLEKTP
jgi:4a-hydroxytetrahydrobiopterin dehydratase